MPSPTDDKYISLFFGVLFCFVQFLNYFRRLNGISQMVNLDDPNLSVPNFMPDVWIFYYLEAVNNGRAAIEKQQLLHRAINSGNTKLWEVLFDFRDKKVVYFDLNYLGGEAHDPSTPLEFAINRRSIFLEVHGLLTRGADPAANGNILCSDLPSLPYDQHPVSEENVVMLYKAFIYHGVSIHDCGIPHNRATDTSFTIRTPLWYAIQAECKECAKLLVQRMVEHKIVIITPSEVSYAAFKQLPEILELLLKTRKETELGVIGRRLNWKNRHGQVINPLHAVCLGQTAKDDGVDWSDDWPLLYAVSVSPE
jgi:hypothetical protein